MNAITTDERLKRDHMGRPIKQVNPITPTQSTVGQYNIVFQDKECVYQEKPIKE